MRTLYFWLMVLAVVDVVFSFPFLFTASPLAVNAFTSGVVVFLAGKIADDCAVIRDRLADRNLTVIRTPNDPPR
jgi:hypothetical protein